MSHGVIIVDKRGGNFVETMEHIFVDCPVAVFLWGQINLSLRMGGLEPVKSDVSTLIYKIGLDGKYGMFVSEVNWALWKNRNKNMKDEGYGYQGASKVKADFVARMGRLSKVDRACLTPGRYRVRWETINFMLEFIKR